MAIAQQRRIPVGLAILATACALGMTAAIAFWFRGSRADSHPVPPAQQSGPPALLITADTAGWIVPCGCVSNQSGGLLRRGTFVAEVRKDAEVVLADVGGAPGGTSPYERAKFAAILKAELAMNIAAHNLGGPEIRLGADYLRSQRDELNFPFVSANVRDAQGNLVTEAARIVAAGGRRVALVGVASPQYKAAGIRIDDPHEAILATLDTIAGRYDDLVVLAYLPDNELRALAARLPEAHVIAGGPTGQSLAPLRVGPSVLLSVTNKGKFIAELRAGNSTGNAWGGDASGSPGRIVELTAVFADDRIQQENLAAYHRELARRDFSAAETGFGPSLPPDLPDSYRVAGTESCRACHADDCHAWENTAHAKAWGTLEKTGSHVDGYCQQCHTTGFGLPGGFASAGKSLQRVGVGCESCHGPALAHVRDPHVRTPFVAKDQCTVCHDHENSPEFNYAAYWDQIIHGVKAKAGAKPALDRPSGTAKPNG